MVPAPLTFVLARRRLRRARRVGFADPDAAAVPDWFRRLRIQMTILVVAALVVAFVATS